MVSDKFLSRRLFRAQQHRAIENATKAATKKALEDSQKAVEAASLVSGGFWLSYIFVLLYLAVAAGAVTHVDLLLENAVKLPFLSIELPLIAFFVIAPWLLLAVHGHMLAHFVLLSKKARSFQELLEKNAKADDDAQRVNLPVNIFIQALVGPRDVRANWFGAFLKLIIWSSLVLAPILVLLELQVQILPHHHAAAVWSVRMAFLVDLVFIWALWRRVFWREKPAPIRTWAGRGHGLVASAIALAFSFHAATYPGEWLHENVKDVAFLPGRWASMKADSKSAAPQVSPRRLLFAGEVNSISRRRNSLFSNTLILHSFNIHDALKLDDPKKLEWKSATINLRGRDLSGIDLSFARLGKADLAKARLEGAQLYLAHLTGANLAGAHLEGAHLIEANLEGANLIEAHLEGAYLARAHLEGAYLVEAHLEGANLVEAHLEVADLEKAHAEGATFAGAHLEGAYLGEVYLKGADLRFAQLLGADLGRAHLAGTALNKSYLWRANLEDAELSSLSTSDLIWLPLTDAFEENLKYWNQDAYTALKQRLTSIAPQAKRLEGALKRLEILDCQRKKPNLQSCDPKAPLQSVVVEMQQALTKASLDVPALKNARTILFGNLLCDGGASRIHALRGILINFDSEFEVETSNFVTRIQAKDCPLSSVLTDDDRTNLLTFEKSAEEESKRPDKKGGQ